MLRIKSVRRIRCFGLQGSIGTVGIGAFTIGMFIASFATGIVGAFLGLGGWACIGLGVSVMIVSQLLYAGLIALRALASRAKTQQDQPKFERSQKQDTSTDLNGNNTSPK